MEAWMFVLLFQVVLAPFTYLHYVNVLSKPSQPKKKRVLQSDNYKSRQSAPPLSKRGLKTSIPLSESPTLGIQVVGGKAVLIKASTSPEPHDEPSIIKTAGISRGAVPPPPPPSIHSKLNPVKPPPSPVVPVQWGPTPILKKEGIDIPTRVLIRLDSYTYDREISNRLVMNVSLKNPGKDGTWCAEKALWDIERDRQ